MGSDLVNQPQWRRTPDGDVILRTIDNWKAGVTEHGDIAICFTTGQGTDPAAPGEQSRAQFICTQEDARAIAQLLLRVVVLSGKEQAAGWDTFCARIQSPALKALAEDWNKARGTRRMPAWGDIAPNASTPYLGGLWAFDYHPGTGDFTGRLAGASIMLAYHRNYQGVSLRELYLPHVRELAEAHLMRVVSEPACVHYTGKIFKRGDLTMEGERLILPMGADPDHPQGVLGATDFEKHPLSHTHEPIEFISDMADWHRL
jgi:hypothetical protein